MPGEMPLERMIKMRPFSWRWAHLVGLKYRDINLINTVLILSIWHLSLRITHEQLNYIILSSKNFHIQEIPSLPAQGENRNVRWRTIVQRKKETRQHNKAHHRYLPESWDLQVPYCLHLAVLHLDMHRSLQPCNKFSNNIYFSGRGK